MTRRAHKGTAPLVLSDAQQAIADKCDELKAFLLEKNASYGNSALEPVRILSKADSVEQIKVRIDDKLNRLIQGSEYKGDDTWRDISGYFVLLLVAQDLQQKKGQPS